MGANGNGAPLLPILYVAANLAFNICSLLVVRTSGGCFVAPCGSAGLEATCLHQDLPCKTQSDSVGPDLPCCACILVDLVPVGMQCPLPCHLLSAASLTCMWVLMLQAHWRTRWPSLR